MLQYIIHYTLHLLVPGLIAWIFFKDQWKKAWLIILATMLVDVDHLLASPIFDANRCSINFHPLHTNYAIVAYILITIPKKSRILGIALLFHMLTDYLDCYF